MRLSLRAAAILAMVLGGCTKSSTDNYSSTGRDSGAVSESSSASEGGGGSSTPASEPLPTPSPEAEEAVRVLEVVDGDTVEVTVDGAEESVRLIGIDAPENGECMSREATAALEELVRPGVRLFQDVSDRDQYGRLLRYVEAGDVFVNEELVRRGLALARDYPPDTARKALLSKAQDDANAANRGIWNPTACGPAATADVEVSNINSDAPGNDNDNLNGEWIELTNRSTADLALTGWVVRDESASHRFPFPDGFVLGAGATVRLHTGCGETNDSSLYWCMQGSAVWNNDGDTVFLLDASGNIVMSKQYSS